MTKQQRGIQWNWSIYRSGHRSATDPTLGITLVVSNGRVGRPVPVVWRAFTVDGLIDHGEVWQGDRYSALVRQAMYDAELAAEAAVCDDCGQVGRHLADVEH